MGLPEADVRARVDAALEAVRMSAYRDRLSHHLSVGEKKRIAIATVLSMNPSLNFWMNLRLALTRAREER